MLLFLLACTPSTPTDKIPQDTQESVDTGQRDPIRDLDPSLLPTTDNPCREPEVVFAKEITDGDTIKVEGKWGGERIRLTGINAPEMNWNTNDPDCWASESMDSLRDMVLDKWVWLTFDKECEDDFERTLAYVHRGTEIEQFVQRSLLRNGHAEAFRVNPNTHFASVFEADERDAFEKQRGLWGACW